MSKPTSKKWQRSIVMLGSGFICGYFFYKMNGGQDVLNSIFFGVGLAGIVLSLYRKKD